LLYELSDKTLRMKEVQNYKNRGF